jgi:hypothetical protein
MRPLLISALATTLAGCACLAPQQPHRVVKAEKTIAASKESLRYHRLVKNAESNIAPQPDASPSAQPHDKPNIAVNEESTVGAKSETLQSSQLGDTTDFVMKRARATVAAKMENPASVEFGEMTRADRKNANGKSIDSVCGFVRGKTASGGETGDRPFLYLVQEDEAYIGGYFIATSPYHNICD